MIGLLKDISSYLSRPYLSNIPKRIDRPFLLLFNLVAICVFAGISAGIFSGILIHSGLIPDPGPNVLDEQKISQMTFLFCCGSTCTSNGGAYFSGTAQKIFWRYSIYLFYLWRAFICRSQNRLGFFS